MTLSSDLQPSSPEPPKNSPQRSRLQRLQPWFDCCLLLSWGALLLKYWATGQLYLLIHPNYFWLVIVTGFSLLGLGGLKVQQVLRRSRHRFDEATPHLSFIPPVIASVLLLLTALLGFLVPPQVLTSQMALQRGIAESLPLTRSQPESFRVAIAPEDRTLIDWVRTLDAYPEPDAYVGQKANIEGFVVRSPELPEGYIFLCRFILTCCAVDAYPVGIPMKLPEQAIDFEDDTWLAVTGNMIVESLPQVEEVAGKESSERQLVLAALMVEEIPTPDNPYAY